MLVANATRSCPGPVSKSSFWYVTKPKFNPSLIFLFLKRGAQTNFIGLICEQDLCIVFIAVS